MEEITLYELLGVPQTATLKEIKIAYRERAMEYHPDSNQNKNTKGCHTMMCKINKAYRILRDSDLRAMYDEKLCEEGKYEGPKEENPSSSEETPSSKTYKKTYKRTYKPKKEQYNYYNTMDFDERTQEEFIKWFDDFSYQYINVAFEYYRELNNDEDGILEKLYDSFDYIINYEKELSKKERKSYSL